MKNFSIIKILQTKMRNFPRITKLDLKFEKSISNSTQKMRT